MRSKKKPVGAMRRTGSGFSPPPRALRDGGATIYGSLMSTP